jgi:alpha-amylase
MVSLMTSGAWKMKNPTLLQCFHWYYPTGGELWREVEALAPNLNEIGINMIWLPPAYKGASGGYSVGYDCYDLFDLGEFDQKGSVATKYGDKAQLLAAISALRQHDIAAA